MLIPKANASSQLAVEEEWLSSLACRTRLASGWKDIVQRIRDVIARPELQNVLEALATHNQNRSTPFLLAPYLFNIVLSLEMRNDNLRRMPALGRRPAELRSHFQVASAKAKALARLVRKAHQPHIVLCAHDDSREVFKLFQPCPIIQAPSQSETTVPLDWLLDAAAASFDSAAKKIPHTHHHRKAQQTLTNADRSQLRRLAARRLVSEFRRNLGSPYHSHVADIVEALTGTATDADYVKKVEMRDRHSNAKSRGQKP